MAPFYLPTIWNVGDYKNRMPVTGVILAGGRGVRMAGRDKGLINYQGQPLIEYLLEAFTPQVDEILISANRNLEKYRQYGHSVLADQRSDFQGPLAGIEAGLTHAKHNLVVFTPCDAPFMSTDYVSRLRDVLENKNSRACYASVADREHPTHLLLNRECTKSLSSYLESGQRKVRNWLRLIEAEEVDFSDIPESFININLSSDLV